MGYDIDIQCRGEGGGRGYWEEGMCSLVISVFMLSVDWANMDNNKRVNPSFKMRNDSLKNSKL